MGPIFNIVLYHCRSNIYLIIGICMGLGVSLFFAPVDIEDCSKTTDSLTNSVDEYEPKINLKDKPQKAQKSPKEFIRPRYYSTELGIREKLFIGVLTSLEHLHDRAIASNRTITHYVDKVRYFISLSEGLKPNVSLPGIVGFTDTREHLKPFHTLKYIIDNYLEDYDFYFFIKDTSYINIRKLKKVVNKLSLSQDVHFGKQIKSNTYCSLDGGILLSNSIIQKLRNNLDWCVKNTYSDYDDVNFGLCIFHSTSVPCVNQSFAQFFITTKLSNNFDFDRDFKKMKPQHYNNSISIYPLYDVQAVYKINLYFLTSEIIQVEEKIEEFRKKILESVQFLPKDHSDISWPIGNEPPSQPFNRFDLLKWTYFNESHVFLENDLKTVDNLEGDNRFDIDFILNYTIYKVIHESKTLLKFKNLENGYWKFDASRGMDYIFDLNFESSSKKIISKRIEVCKPLGKPEILPVPYVTENSRIHLLIPVSSKHSNEAWKFLKIYGNCLEKKNKLSLTMIFLYEPDAISKGNSDPFSQCKQQLLLLTDKFSKIQSKSNWLSIRLPISYNLIEIEPLLMFAAIDLGLKKLTSDSLVLLGEVRMELQPDFLNRVRMNTINQWQFFSPISFAQYHPAIINYNENGKPSEFDILRNHGRYNEYDFNTISFYVADYFSARKLMRSKIPIAKTEKDLINILKLSSTNDVNSIFDMFISYTKLHPFRAVEPALKLKYKDFNCNGTNNNKVQQVCIKQANLNLGTRAQLTRLILDYNEQSHRDI